MISSIDVEKKIRAFVTIEDIISAMKAYAGITIRKTEELVLNIRKYEENILSALADVIAYYPDLLGEKSDRKRILVAYGSSQGLCGSYNEKLADVVSDTKKEDDELFVIGRKLKSSLESRQLKYDYFNDSIGSVHGIEEALRETLSRIMNIYKQTEVYNLIFIFITISGTKAETSIEQILPPDVSRVHALKPQRPLPLTYLEPVFILNKALEELLYISLYRGFIESLRSENWYRLRSMEGAAESLKGRISDLNSLQKYIRQEEITEEMLEILGSGMFYR
ncbi:MAG: F0F1 ATP synthase subunit gamma [Nitrospirota bacterium]